MKKISLIIPLLILLIPLDVFSCELCKNNQPKILRGITHGVGPQGNWDYIIIWFAAIIVAITLFLSIKYLVKPQGNNADHIKNIILNQH